MRREAQSSDLVRRVAMLGRMGRAALLVLAVTCAASVAFAQGGQDKSAPLSKVQRLGRAPINKEVLRVKLPRPVVEKLPNGLTLVMLEDHKLPTVSFTMWIRPGQLADPADLPGLASFTAEMLREGTEKRTSSQIASEVDSLGATLAAESRFGASYTSVTASGLVEDAPQILDLLSDVALHPAFPESELSKYKQRQEAALEERLANPAFLAQQEFRLVVYQKPPLSFNSATKESIEKITQADLKKFHAEHYTPGNTILGIAGDFKPAEMRGVIAKYFGAWSGKADRPVELPATPSAEAAEIILVDRPGSVQTYIMGGDRTVRRTDPEYYNLAVMNQIIGGGPQARLFLDLREEHGYTYGAFSRFNSDVYPGEWYGVAPVRTAVTESSMTQFMYEYKRIRSEAVPEGEMGDAHRAIVANFALSLEQPATVLSDWLTVTHFGLPLDYWDTYPDHISAVDAAKVEEAAKRFIDLDHMQWVCVGDRAKIQDVLAKFGRVKVVDVTGKEEN
jgi:zinc protease